MKTTLGATLVMLMMLVSSTVDGGIYSGPTDTSNSIDGGIAFTDSRFVQWANVIDESRTILAPRGSTTINQTGSINSLGDLDAAQIAGGMSPGFLTVQFPTGIRDGVGADFAIFENGFAFGQTDTGSPGLFAEFAYVDVSSNGSEFARFPSIYLNSGALPGGFGSAFSAFDVTNVFNLAGKHASGIGTPFDLASLIDDPLVRSGQVNLNSIQYVRMFDIPGNGSFTDSLGNPIYDNWLTSGSGGFDFRLGEGLGVGVINATAVPEPSSMTMFAMIAGGIAYRRRHQRRAVQVG